MHAIDPAGLGGEAAMAPDSIREKFTNNFATRNKLRVWNRGPLIASSVASRRRSLMVGKDWTTSLGNPKTAHSR